MAPVRQALRLICHDHPQLISDPLASKQPCFQPPASNSEHACTVTEGETEDVITQQTMASQNKSSAGCTTNPGWRAFIIWLLNNLPRVRESWNERRRGEKMNMEYGRVVEGWWIVQAVRRTGCPTADKSGRSWTETMQQPWKKGGGYPFIVFLSQGLLASVLKGRWICIQALYTQYANPGSLK